MKKKTIKAWAIEIDGDPFGLSHPDEMRFFQLRRGAQDYVDTWLDRECRIVPVEIHILPPKKKTKPLSNK